MLWEFEYLMNQGGSPSTFCELVTVKWWKHHQILLELEKSVLVRIILWTMSDCNCCTNDDSNDKMSQMRNGEDRRPVLRKNGLIPPVNHQFHKMVFPSCLVTDSLFSTLTFWWTNIQAGILPFFFPIHDLKISAKPCICTPSRELLGFSYLYDYVSLAGEDYEI